MSALRPRYYFFDNKVSIQDKYFRRLNKAYDSFVFELSSWPLVNVVAWNRRLELLRTTELDTFWLVSAN